MRIFAIKDDTMPKETILGYLVYYENAKSFYMEFTDGIDPWDVPPVLSAFIERGEYSIDSYGACAGFNSGLSRAIDRISARFSGITISGNTTNSPCCSLRWVAANRTISIWKSCPPIPFPAFSPAVGKRRLSMSRLWKHRSSWSFSETAPQKSLISRHCIFLHANLS